MQLRLRKADRVATASSVCVAAGTATNPGINDQNAALTPFGSTGTMKMTILSKKYTDALFREPSKQCELIPVLFFLSTSFQNGPKWTKNAPNGRYHAPDFSLKNAKLRLNIIIIITCSFMIAFIASNHLYSSVIRTWRAHLPKDDSSPINLQ